MNRRHVRQAVEQCTIFLIRSPQLGPLDRVAAAVMLLRFLTRAALFAGLERADAERAAATAHEWANEDEGDLEPERRGRRRLN